MIGDRKAPRTATVTGSGDARADRGGVANSGIIIGDVRTEFHEHHHHAPRVVTWPVQVGMPPASASAFQPRREVRDRLVNGGPSETRPAWVLAGGGGVGKSQLAAWLARRALDERTADLVAWVTASSPEQIVTTYARAAARVGAPGADGDDPAADAAVFCEWLHTTDRSWLIVLDDVDDPGHLAGWWPPRRPRGAIVATTRRHDAALTGSGRQRIEIGVFSPDESEAYLTERLTEAGCADLLDEGAPGLAAALGHLPLALSHAAAYMIDQAIGCAEYLGLYTRAARVAEVMPVDSDADGYGRPVAVTLLLALDAADAAEPAGLARPVLALAAALDPDGHPDQLWRTAAVAGYLSGCAGRPVTGDEARRAVRALHRYGLLTHTPADGPRAVRIHALTARAAREAGLVDPATVVQAAAAALLEVWPDADHTTTDLVDALRTNATALAGDLLWAPGGRALLYRAGASLLESRLHAAAVTYWQRMVDDATRLLGDEHPDTVTAHAKLGSSLWQAGRTAETIAVLERVVADRVRLFGDEHPDTISARVDLAGGYRQAGRTADALVIDEKVVDDATRLLGEEHPDTVSARASLGSSLWQVGRTGEAVAVLERVVADRVRLFGDEHPDTLRARIGLAACYRQAGRTADAVALDEKAVGDAARLLGDEHPDTMIARAGLASSYWEAGRRAEAVGILERLVADRVRLFGDEHPDTISARVGLAACYRESGRTADAIAVLEKVVNEEALDDRHPTVVAAVDLLRQWRAEG
ncbi:tetratricopeptide (TPR) repeat protein [Actinoplanes octamycinicus]|uniref:Tetratricopeptide (TPR) repeat protein n=1 Tax=Actinoplanes octamycinicus TaxID=135948 RepID=A0A7W7MAI8_9ACTN|nr:FxSxx-COOH system tetratricopeptide repeat protein [Actinoplanes octamycinicus]MBB4743042.1 tetratricopeptide (TPR) repeat protein [Actinoplanes octamycinicus]GIE58103.1 tetratricopeptide repeat protein [Actinoplanes octamycinicus]